MEMIPPGQYYRLPSNWVQSISETRKNIIRSGGMRVRSQQVAQELELLDLPKGELGLYIDGGLPQGVRIGPIMKLFQFTTFATSACIIYTDIHIDEAALQALKKVLLFGPIPKRLFNALIAAPKLKSLDISSGQRGDLACVNSPELEYLRNASGLPLPSASRLRNLRHLFVSNSRKPYSLASLSESVNLNFLQLHYLYGGIVGFDALSELKHIRLLDMSSVPSIENYEILLRMPKIEQFVRGGTKAIPVEFYEKLDSRWGSAEASHLA